MNELQRKGFLDIVRENGTYDDFYETRYEEKDKTLVSRNQKDIDAHLKLQETKAEIDKKNKDAKSARAKKHDVERRALQEKQNKECKILEDRISAENVVGERAEDKAIDTVETQLTKLTIKLESTGLKQSYHYGNDNTREHYFEVNIARFRDNYDNWRRNIVAEILACTDAKDALKLVKDFIPKFN